MSRRHVYGYATLRCRLFGHAVPEGYGKGTPYGRLIFAGRDGLNTTHVAVEVKCPRCSDRYILVKFHLPHGQLPEGVLP